MSAPFCHRRRVEFRDTDAAGIVHFSVFFNYMEEAEHAFLRNLGLDVFLVDNETAISFPRVAAKCDYRSPIRFGELVDVETNIERIGKSSVTYKFLFRRDETVIAEGQITAACCELTESGDPRTVLIPENVRTKLERA
ncbi:MAG: thioesterase family protein [Planctomycetota bacterium]|nr:thioesterase family protein [Planctomycetota bacterium]